MNLEKVAPGTVVDARTLNKVEETRDSQETNTIHLEPLPAEFDDYPDGGWRAWSIVFGATCVTWASFGYVNSWGAFQQYYEEEMLPNSPPSTIAWIGSIQYSLTFFPGLLMGRLFDKGWFKIPLFFASCLMVLSALLTAQCKGYWQFLLVQGILTGTASGCCFGPCLGTVSHWFKRRRNLAFSIVAIGSSIGGTTFPLIIRALVPRVGFQWTVRIIAFMLLAILGVANLTLRTRLPPRKLTGAIVDLGHLREPPYTLYTIACFIGFLGMYTVLTFIGTSARLHGVSSGDAYTLVSIANAASLLGRLTTGFLADKHGCLNVLMPFCFITGIVTIAWPFATTYATIIVVGALYGFFCGAFVGIVAAPIASLSHPQQVGERTGLMFTLVGVGALIGPPISGAIKSATGGYTVVGGYAGSTIIVSVMFMLVVKYHVTGSLIKGKL